MEVELAKQRGSLPENQAISLDSLPSIPSITKISSAYKKPLHLAISRKISTDFEEPQVTLRKLPMWGKKIRPSQINFEWPTEEIAC